MSVTCTVPATRPMWRAGAELLGVEAAVQAGRSSASRAASASSQHSGLGQHRSHIGQQRDLRAAVGRLAGRDAGSRPAPPRAAPRGRGGGNAHE